LTPDEARSRFETGRVARLATVDAEGAPHVVPVTFALEGDRIVTAVDAKPKRASSLKRLANVAANPRVSLLVDEYDEDWDRLWWARADGLARVVDLGPDLDRSISLLRERYAQYTTVALIGPAVVVEVERWVGWSAAGG
jgi:PPOX class probable F420-dependent enzyme